MNRFGLLLVRTAIGLLASGCAPVAAPPPITSTEPDTSQAANNDPSPDHILARTPPALALLEERDDLFKVTTSDPNGSLALYVASEESERPQVARYAFFQTPDQIGTRAGVSVNFDSSGLPQEIFDGNDVVVVFQWESSSVEMTFIRDGQVIDRESVERSQAQPAAKTRRPQEQSVLHQIWVEARLCGQPMTVDRVDRVEVRVDSLGRSFPARYVEQGIYLAEVSFPGGSDLECQGEIQQICGQLDLLPGSVCRRLGVLSPQLAAFCRFISTTCRIANAFECALEADGSGPTSFDAYGCVFPRDLGVPIVCGESRQIDLADPVATVMVDLETERCPKLNFILVTSRTTTASATLRGTSDTIYRQTSARFEVVDGQIELVDGVGRFERDETFGAEWSHTNEKRGRLLIGCCEANARNENQVRITRDKIVLNSRAEASIANDHVEPNRVSSDISTWSSDVVVIGLTTGQSIRVTVEHSPPAGLRENDSAALQFLFGPKTGSDEPFEGESVVVPDFVPLTRVISYDDLTIEHGPAVRGIQIGLSTGVASDDTARVTTNTRLTIELMETEPDELTSDELQK